eukprot:459082_1
MANRIPIISVRAAPLSGKISWTSFDSITMKLNDESYIFTLQTRRWFAFAESHLYKPWRIVMTQKGQWVGHVVGEFDKEAQAIQSLFEIKSLFEEAFEKIVHDTLDLKHGDIVSVPTTMLDGKLRHFGIYDQEYNQVIEYQEDESGGGKGSVQATPLDAFCDRVKKQYKGELNLRKHEYMKQQVFGDREVVKRARNRLNQRGYHVIYQNCECFAVWCKTGKAQSIQSRSSVTIALDIALKVVVVAAVVLSIGAIVYYVTSAGIITINAATSSTVCEACRHTGNLAKMHVGVAGPFAGVAIGVLDHMMENHNRFEDKIIKEGSVFIQCGLNGSIQERQIKVTEKRLLITDDTKDDTVTNDKIVSVEWINLVNIDDLNGQNSGHSFQLLFKDETYPNIYIYCASKSQKTAWIKMFKR